MTGFATVRTLNRDRYGAGELAVGFHRVKRDHYWKLTVWFFKRVWTWERRS